MNSSEEIRRPAPIITADNAGFWENCRDGRLTGQQCSSCARLRHPPRPMCPHCGSLEHELVELAGTGTVYSCVALHHPKSPQFDYPVVAALVDLDEGVRMVTNLEGLAHADVTVGMRVEVRFAATLDGYRVPVFSRARARAS